MESLLLQIALGTLFATLALARATSGQTLKVSSNMKRGGRLER